MPGRAEGAVRLWWQGLEELSRMDPDLRRACDEAGPPPLELREAGFAALLRAIVAQQVSTASARAIWGRVLERVDPLAPEPFLALGEEGIRALGFSRQKIRYSLALAEELASGRLDLSALEEMEDEAALAELVRLKGIGRWSAEVYLLFALGRPNVWPADDLALAVAVQRLRKLESRPTAKQLRALGEDWRPWRSVAAIVLWHYYKLTP